MDAKHETKGLLRGLFDFSFTTFVTVKFARLIYGLLLLGWALGWLAFIFSTLNDDFMGGGQKALLIVIVLPIGAILSLIYLRVLVESMVVVFRIAEDTGRIARWRGDSDSTASIAAAAPVAPAAAVTPPAPDQT